jgi:uncharacterized protein involved in response to NO
MTVNVDHQHIALAIPPLWRLAFRPLFLGGTLFSILAMGWWIYFWLQPLPWNPYGGPVFWHGHEMLFGFGAAIVTGFLLTAVQSWTGVVGLRGKPLVVLVVSWLSSRLLLAFATGLPGWLLATVDVAYLLMAASAMAYPVIKVKQWSNLMFVPMLFTLAILNGVGHWGVNNGQLQLALQSLHGAIMLFTLIIAVVGGRVIPAFTSNTTGCPKAVPIVWLEVTSMVSIMLLLLIALMGFANMPPLLLFGVAVVAALANGWRLLRWGFQHSGAEPLLWSLHLAYAFIPFGFVLLALHSVGLLDNGSAALHSFTVGAMGGMILAMISRVTLGHTGRPLIPPRLVKAAYIAITVAAIIRVVVSAWWPEFAHWGIATAGLMWIFAYGIYLYFYAPMLLTMRADGRPG